MQRRKRKQYIKWEIFGFRIIVYGRLRISEVQKEVDNSNKADSGNSDGGDSGFLPPIPLDNGKVNE